MNEEQKDVEVQETTTEANNTPNERKGFNVTSLILGFISIVTSFFYWYAALPAGIIGIIFGIAGRKDAGKEYGTFGIVLGVIGFIVSLVKVFI